MIFSVGSTFVFRSWICEAGDDGKLRSRLLEDPVIPTDQFAKKFSQLMTSDPTRILKQIDLNSNTVSIPSPFSIDAAPIYQEYDSDTTFVNNSVSHPSIFPLGLNNSVSIYQGQTSSAQRIPLIGAQEGLMLTITPQDYLVHWPSSIPGDGRSRLTSITEFLPYQEGNLICEDEIPTKILDNSDMTGSSTDDRGVNASQVVFMVRCPRSPLIPPKASDVRSSDESKTNISPDDLGDTDEAESHKQARLRRNKLKQGRRNHARQWKEA
jgi:hypothetical protein